MELVESMQTDEDDLLAMNGPDTEARCDEMGTREKLELKLQRESIHRIRPGCSSESDHCYQFELCSNL